MNAAFSSPEFWKLFFALKGDFSVAQIQAQLDLLGADYPTHEETVTWQFTGKTEVVTRRFVAFTFACGKRFSPMLEYEPDPRGSSKTLFLLDVKSGDKHRLGSSDRAAGRPYCLRLEELQLLLEHGVRKDRRWKHPDTALLLLCDFVGFADDQVLASWQGRVQRTVDCLLQHVPERPEIELRRAVAGYRWCYDPRIPGWVFKSEKSSSLSTRNAEHLGSEEGSSPSLSGSKCSPRSSRACSDYGRESATGPEPWLLFRKVRNFDAFGS